MCIILTIGIPVYNGETTIQGTLDSVIKQMIPGIEIVISDNNSTDKTAEIIRHNYPVDSNIKYFKNETNIGADRNIDLVVKRSSGRYVWLLGDDDEISPGGIKKIMNIILNNSELAAIFVNYGLYDRVTNACLQAKTLKLKDDILLFNADEFLNIAGIYPNFMSSIVVSRSLWGGVDSKKYEGTHWLQYGMLMRILEGQKSFCTAEPYVMNKGVEKNGPNEANKNGASIQVLVNLVEIVESLPNKFYSSKSIEKTKYQAYKFLARKIFSAKRYGLAVTPSLLKLLIKTFGAYPAFWVRELPLLLLPSKFHYMTWKIYKSRLIQIAYWKLLEY